MDKAVDFPVLKGLMLTVMEMIREEAVRMKVTTFDEAQREKTDELEESVEISEEQSAVPKPALKKTKSRKG